MTSTLSDLQKRTPIANSALSVVLLMRNAGPDLPDLLENWQTVLKKRELDYEMIVVDDGSSDGSGALAEELASAAECFQVVHHEQPMGLGAALQSGYSKAVHPLVCFSPLDHQFQPREISNLLQMIDSVDVALGQRNTRKNPWYLRYPGIIWRLLTTMVIGFTPEQDPYWRGWGAWRNRQLAYWFFALRVHDLQTPFSLWRRDLLRRIPLQSRTSLALIELLAKANFLNGIMTEVPVSYQPPPREQEKTNLVLEKSTWREWQRLISDPDFGPPSLHVESLQLSHSPEPLLESEGTQVESIARAVPETPLPPSGAQQNSSE